MLKITKANIHIQNTSLINQSMLSNPMYRLSMSSLELFHSNFLACLFQEDINAFLKCFGVSYPGNTSDLVLIREYELGSMPQNGKQKKYVTDIMVGAYNNGSKKSINPLLIIENKIKSYPQIDQLNGQSILVSNINQGCKKVILSIFPIHSDITNKSGFQFISYSDLIKNIRTFFKGINGNFSRYISDYCNMMDELYQILSKYLKVPQNIQKKNFLFPIDFSELTDISFIDAYRKYQASLLYYDGIQILSNCESFKSIYGGHGLSNKHAICSFFLPLITPKGDQEELALGVQIEHNQFRVCFVGKHIERLLNGHQSKIVSLPSVITDTWNCLLGSNQKGQSRNTISGTGKHNQFCTYSDDFVYRYIDIYNTKTINQPQLSKISFEQLISTGFGSVTTSGRPLSVKTVLEYAEQNKNKFVKNIPYSI